MAAHLHEPAQHIRVVVTDPDRQQLLHYLASDDDRTDVRPDVRSKHPRWNQDSWPQQIVQKHMDNLFPGGYEVEEITFMDSRIGLCPHTDNGGLAGTVGKTLMFCLSAEPEAHTIFFDNYWTGWAESGVFFTRSPWSPYQCRIPNVNNELTYVADIRQLLDQCRSDPRSVTEFVVTEDFIQQLEHTIHKRSLPRLSVKDQDSNTGFIQPGPRINAYHELTNYDPDRTFPDAVAKRYLSQVPAQDLQGLELASVMHWSAGDAIIFERCQLHASSGCHARKSFITIFFHELSGH